MSSRFSKLARRFGISRTPKDEVILPDVFPANELTGADPVSEMVGAPHFQLCTAFFAGIPAINRALVSAETQALLFSLTRNLRAEVVIEIGTYRASTTEAMARAVWANGRGCVHTIDPFADPALYEILSDFPTQLRNVVSLHEMSSADFFGMAFKQHMQADLVFVDGNHDYEFALFDLQCASRLLRSGGFIVLDNISQAGPFFASRDFLAQHPGWSEAGQNRTNYRPGLAFDPHRARIVNTDSCVLRSPRRYLVGSRPTTPGEQVWLPPELCGILAVIAAPATGTLYAQAVIRIFGVPPVEITVEGSVILDNALGTIQIAMPWRFDAKDLEYPRRVELWLSWEGGQPLELQEQPALLETWPAERSSRPG